MKYKDEKTSMKKEEEKDCLKSEKPDQHIVSNIEKPENENMQVDDREEKLNTKNAFGSLVIDGATATITTISSANEGAGGGSPRE